MSWKDDVVALLPLLPAEFRLEELYRFVPLLHAKHPDNFHVEDKIRQVLQQLRADGVVTFVDGAGTYRHALAREPSPAPFPFSPHQVTSRAEIAKALGQAGDAALRRGMFKPAKGPFRQHMLLFHNETSNPYGDVHEGSTIRYVGQGMQGNQELKGFNGTLATHLEQGVQVHYFVQPRDLPGKVRYVGQVFVEEFKEATRDDRTVWEFTLLPVDGGLDPVTDYADMLRGMLDYDRPPGPVERPVVERISRVRLRDRAFRELVIPAYRRLCAVCKEPLTKGSRLSELQAAHIQAVHANGPDELRNALSLCGRHHWAFDNGLFTVGDDLRVQWLAPSPDPHREVRDGMDLFVPVDDEHKPHSSYLQWHRSFSGLALNSMA